MNKKIFCLTLRTGLAFLAVALPAAAVDLAGLDAQARASILYYDSFGDSNGPDVVSIDLRKFTRAARYKKKDGISGAYGVLLSGTGLYLEGTAISLRHNRTLSYWFKFAEALPENGGGSFFANVEQGAKKPKFLSVFARGGPWCALDDTALVAQCQNFKDMHDVSTIVDRAFRRHYAAGIWHHFALTSNGKDILIYLDGRLVASMTMTRPLREDDNLNGLRIGEYGSVPFQIDELMILDLALPASQVQAYVAANQSLMARQAQIREGMDP